MTTLSKSAFIAKYTDASTGEFPDNTSQLITATNLRNQAQDIADSFVSKDTDISSAPLTVQVGIDSPEVLTANGTPVVIVAAPGAARVIVPIMFYVFLDYGGSAFATNTTFRFEINGVAFTATNTTILPGTADRHTTIIPIAVDTTTNLSNQPLVFEVQTGNPTAGNSPIFVKCVYKIFDTITPL